MNLAERLMEVYERLLAHHGPRDWWPAETPFEVCVGAILTQNTSWANVEKAIANLKREGVLNIEGMRRLDQGQLATLVHPAGYYNVKSRRLKDFVDWLFKHHGGSLEQMFDQDGRTLRTHLLEVRGIGPETCDSILLYAGGIATFVVDSYTRRLFHRLSILATGANASYDEIRLVFMANVPAVPALYNEYHALIVQQCKMFCRTLPRCPGCPLATICLYDGHGMGAGNTLTSKH